MPPVANGVTLGANGANGNVPVETETPSVNGTESSPITAVTPGNATSQVQTQITLGGKIIAGATLPPRQAVTPLIILRLTAFSSQSLGRIVESDSE
jgi:hypothetical protein